MDANIASKPLGGLIGCNPTLAVGAATNCVSAGSGRYVLRVLDNYAQPFDTYLEVLRILPGQYSPAFQQDVTRYTAYVQYVQTTLTINANALKPATTSLTIAGVASTSRTVTLNPDNTFTTDISIVLTSQFLDSTTLQPATRTYVITVVRYSRQGMAAFYRFARVGETCPASVCNTVAQFCTCGGACSGAVEAAEESATSGAVQFSIYVDAASWSSTSNTFIAPAQIGPLSFSYRITSGSLFYQQTYDLQVTGACGLFFWSSTVVSEFTFLAYLANDISTLLNPTTGA